MARASEIISEGRPTRELDRPGQKGEQGLTTLVLADSKVPIQTTTDDDLILTDKENRA